MIGYGEDALTFWALRSDLRRILRELDDQTDPESCLRIYRPSFGRGGGKANFGEFDSILATRKSVYLIESKWDDKDHERKWSVRLQETQVRRHEIFRWYFLRWPDDKFGDWGQFVERYEGHFSQEFKGKTIAKQGTLLSGNLMYILGRLKGYPRHLTDVLLFFDSGENVKPSNVNPPGFFKLVVLPYSRLPRSHYVDMQHVPGS